MYTVVFVDGQPPQIKGEIYGGESLLRAVLLSQVKRGP